MLNSQQFHTRAGAPGVPLRRNPQQFGDGEQLQMFMPARDLYNANKTSDAPYYSSREQMWKQKLIESRVGDSPRHRSTYESIKESGVKTPVGVWQEEGGVDLRHGHHRVAVAHDIDPAMEIPVYHSRDVFSGPNSETWG